MLVTTGGLSFRTMAHVSLSLLYNLILLHSAVTYLPRRLRTTLKQNRASTARTSEIRCGLRPPDSASHCTADSIASSRTDRCPACTAASRTSSTCGCPHAHVKTNVETTRFRARCTTLYPNRMETTLPGSHRRHPVALGPNDNVDRVSLLGVCHLQGAACVGGCFTGLS